MNSFIDFALEHIKNLSTYIGSKRIGSPVNLAAADYTSEIFGDCGFTLERQEIPCQVWVVEQTSLVVKELDKQDLSWSRP